MQSILNLTYDCLRNSIHLIFANLSKILGNELIESLGYFLMSKFRVLSQLI
jgi:hypothetical protein